MKRVLSFRDPLGVDKVNLVRKTIIAFIFVSNIGDVDIGVRGDELFYFLESKLGSS